MTVANRAQPLSHCLPLEYRAIGSNVVELVAEERGVCASALTVSDQPCALHESMATPPGRALRTELARRSVITAESAAH